MGLAQLPTELYAAIIHQIQPEDVQQSLLALSRAIPLSPVPLHALFENIRLRDPRQVACLHRHLRKDPQDAAYVRTFALESWTVDADVFVNLLAMLPHVRELTISIGINFAPEHLEDLFKKPRPHLKYLSLRFRPYVQRATYLQFMKGAYFDSTLLALSRWPRAELPVLSVIQDPITAAMVPEEKFAQPIVFFHLDPLSALSASPYASTVTHFRFRVPRRQIGRYIVKNSGSLPRVELLDLATCNVSPLEIQDIVLALQELKYLVLDDCPVVTQRVDALDAAGAEDYSQWAALGVTLATTGLRAARARERKLQRWLETIAVVETMQDLEITPGAPSPSNVKKRTGRNKVAMSPFKLRAPSSKYSSEGGSTSTRPSGRSSVERIRVLPPVPTLHSLALTAPMISSGNTGLEARCSAARAAFELGWAEGLAAVTQKRSLIRTSWTNGVRVMRMVKLGREADKERDDEQGFAGLESVEESEEFNIQDERCPRLCLAGPGREGHHLDRCPHMVGWEVFKDEL